MFFRCGGLCAILPGGGERVDFLVDFVEVSLMDCEVIWYVGTIGFDFAPFFRAVERDWT